MRVRACTVGQTDGQTECINIFRLCFKVLIIKKDHCIWNRSKLHQFIEIFKKILVVCSISLFCQKDLDLVCQSLFDRKFI